MAVFSNVAKSTTETAEVDYLFTDNVDYVFTSGDDYVFVEASSTIAWTNTTKNAAVFTNQSKN